MKFSATLQMVLTERLNLKVYDFFVLNFLYALRIVIKVIVFFYFFG